MDRDRGSVKDGQQNGRVIVNGNASTSTSTNTNTTTPRHSGNIATQQRADQAVAILANEQLMLRYALANDLSVAKIRTYFEKIAGGFDPKPVISDWDIFED